MGLFSFPPFSLRSITNVLSKIWNSIFLRDGQKKQITF